LNRFLDRSLLNTLGFQLGHTMNVTRTSPNILTPAGDDATSTSSFNKYELYGAYHYNRTLGAPFWNDYDVRLAARYITAVKMLAPHRGETVLDAGSGEGVASILCAREGANVVAVELDTEAGRLGTEIARREGFSPEQLTFKQDNLYSLSLPDESIDKIVSLEVIEHMNDRRAYLKELCRVMKKGGRIVISTPMKRADGVLQDRYHVEEFDHESLRLALGEVFSEVTVSSCWTAERNRRYESNRPFALAARFRRSVVRLGAYCARNPFVGPVPPDAGCSLVLATGVK